MTTFNELLAKTSKEVNSLSYTENGALGYSSTNNALVDFNFRLPSYRNDISSAITDFISALNFDAILTMRYLFFLRDIRGGLGERNTFRHCLSYVLNYYKDISKEQLEKLLKLVPEYGRWDDLIFLYNTSENTKVCKIIFEIIRSQLLEDYSNCLENKPISLLAKWMPSVQNGSRKTAKMFIRDFKCPEKEYRKMLSKLRTQINIVESKMSRNEWKKIDYSVVPSKANVKYNNAFMRHDSFRRMSFLEKVKNGEEKINGAVNFPHDIIRKYIKEINDDLCWTQTRKCTIDHGLEALWKALPNFISDNNILVVADVSFSMYEAKAIPICYGLAIYFAERATGQFKDKAILFSSHPYYINITGNDLCTKLNTLLKLDDYTNTDIEKTFDLILKTAVDNNLKQEDLPKALLIISDMEFDLATTTHSRRLKFDTLFDTIKDKFKSKGYEMPKLIFWNVSSRTNTIPITENKYGVILVSGFSTNVVKMVLSQKLNPFEALKEQILSERYNIIEDILLNK